jgi:hypothetical protein
MSIPDIRNALENALDAMTPAIKTVHEGESYTPVTGTPYQEAYLLAADPRNSTMGDGYYQENGIFQVNLMYPAGVGTLAASTRAEMIRDQFKRGASFTFGGTTVQIEKTPAFGGGEVVDGRWRQVIRVRWFADIQK